MDERAQADGGADVATMDRGTKGTTRPEWRRAFLRLFARTGNVTLALKASGKSRTHVYRLIRRDPDFRRRFHAARKAARDRLEAEAWKCAMLGYEEVKTYEADGRTRTETTHKRDMALLGRLLQANWPEKYGKKSTLEVKDGRLSPTEATAARKLLADPTSRELLCQLAERQAELGRADPPALAAPPSALDRPDA